MQQKKASVKHYRNDYFILFIGNEEYNWFNYNVDMLENVIINIVDEDIIIVSGDKVSYKYFHAHEKFFDKYYDEFENIKIEKKKPFPWIFMPEREYVITNNYKLKKRVPYKIIYHGN